MSDQQVRNVLSSIDRYEQKSISVLEEYVKNSVANKQHNLEANLALVKLYQFYPQQLNLSLLTLILAQSLLHHKEQAFNLVLFMLPEKIHKDSNVSKLTGLNEALDNAQYADFWTKLKDANDLVAGVPDFEAQVRDTIFTVLRRTYRNVSQAHVASALGLAEPKTFFEERGQKVSGDDVLMTPPESSEPQTAARENIPFSQLVGVISSIH